MSNVLLRSKGLVLGLALLSLVAVAGCSGGGAEVKGTVLFNGQAVKLGAGEQLQINLVGVDGSKPVLASASYDQSSGTFRVAGPTGRGLPEGKYRIAVSTSSYGPQQKGDRFRGAFGASNSPLVASINPGSQNLTVDLGKRSVTVQ
ncbi:MAG: hypothetical protein L0Z62_47670 [Gemmataceae bacterium]|nr:hypothetical protein [Gemmataceae bacterium]